jgi:hypothetical protein
MPAATPPRPPKAIQDIIDGVADHGVDYDTDKVEALPLTPTGKTSFLARELQQEN